MSNVQKLDDAINMLDSMRRDRQYVEVNGWLAEPNTGDTPRSPLDGPPEDLVPVTNDLLIVVLHRTIDAQLSILRAAKGGASDIDQGATPDEPASVQEALALASAIVGGAL